MESIRDRERSRFRRDSHCRFVSSDQFLTLATSRQKLVGFDPATAGLKGLLNISANMLYLVEEERLGR